MTAARVLSDLSRVGVSIRLIGDRLTLAGAPASVARVTPLVRDHRAEIIASLTQTIPAHVSTALTHAGYSLPDWTPPSCRVFLAQLREECPGFRVNGWYGLTMPRSWPPEFADAVQSIYIRSVQDQ